MQSVLFIYRNKNLADQFAKHFVLNGYQLYLFYDEEIPYDKISKIQKLQNVFYRVVLKNTSFIHKLHDANFVKHSNIKLKQLKKSNLKFDYCFVIRGDLIPENILKYSRSISKKMIDYQLDGLSVSKKILDYKNYFNQIFVFDESDVQNYPNYNLKAITNCFFEEDNNLKKDIDFSYIGVNTNKRLETLEKLYDYLLSINQKFNIQFFLKQHEYKPEESTKIKLLEKSLDYKTCLNLSAQSKVIIDLKRAEHDGLSLRFFEALQYESKIITNNKSVKNYDFYNPENILITNFKDFTELEKFLKIPYKKIPLEIKEKYNFKNWIKQILN